MAFADPRYDRLLAFLKDAANINAAKNLLVWDMETIMPEAGADARSGPVSCLEGLAHEKLTSAEYRDLLSPLAELRDAGGIPADDPAYAVVGLAWKNYRREARLPSSFVTELSALCASSHHVWKDAREKKDWAAFLPNLTRIVAMKREEARLVGFTASPYDALLDAFEPGMDAAKTSALLDGIAPPLAALVRRIGASPTDRGPEGTRVAAPLAAQAELNRVFATRLGFDLRGGRIDPTAHPFMTRIHVGDIRICTRYDEADALYALMSTFHEAGHGMFEQGLPSSLYGTPAGEVASFALHESQSRLWENMVCRSLPFCEFLARELGAAGIGAPPAALLHRALNAVAPSFIRTEADEVTYNLHICLRFRIERDLIEGSLDPADVPAAWNALSREYFGIEPEHDADGALQDVHWSAGLFGYFPTYALGNLYAAQLYEAASREIPGLEDGFREGRFADLLAWLRDRVHRHGSLVDAATIVARATGKPPSPVPFLAYVERKYSAIYGL